ncbi:MAG: methionine--tRNA ligase subunit beta, partial [Nitrospiraceae bacterium]
EVLGFLQTQKLGDLSISRPKTRLTWGIELPFDRDYVTYVWFDALINYVSALEYLASTNALERFWPADVHLIGKDILTTHAVYWSTMLMALGLELPRTIFAHGWWTVDGEKMSKSRGNVVDPYKMVDMVDEFGVDAFRYFLLREVPFGQDGNFSQTAMATSINSDLANGIGNLLSRTLTMIERFSDARIPERAKGEYEGTEDSIMEEVQERFRIAEQHFSTFRFKDDLEGIWWIIRLCDKLIDESQPWKLVKSEESRPTLEGILNTLARALRGLSIFLYPYMPTVAQEIHKQLGVVTDWSQPLLKQQSLWDAPLGGTRIQKGAPLFPRIVKTISDSFSPGLTEGSPRIRKTEHQDTVTKPQGAKDVSDSPASSQSTAAPTSTTAAPQSPAPVAAAPTTVSLTQITIDEFTKIQLKTATVLTAERVPKSEKLIKLQVDLGTEQRQIVAGIGKKYEPEALIGKRIVIVVNLKPAKLMGIESQGMVLAAGDKEVGGLVTVLEDVEPGTKVK